MAYTSDAVSGLHGHSQMFSLPDPPILQYYSVLPRQLRLAAILSCMTTIYHRDAAHHKNVAQPPR